MIDEEIHETKEIMENRLDQFTIDDTKSIRISTPKELGIKNAVPQRLRRAYLQGCCCCRVETGVREDEK